MITADIVKRLSGGSITSLRTSILCRYYHTISVPLGLLLEEGGVTWG